MKFLKEFKFAICSIFVLNSCFAQIDSVSSEPQTYLNCATCSGISWQGAGFFSTTAGSISKQLNLTNFGFNIPSNAIVKGMRLAINQFTCSPENYYDSNVQILINGIASGQNKAYLTNFPPSYPNPYTMYYGRSNDLWQNLLTATDVNNVNFGFTYQIVQNISGGWCFYLWPRLTIYYEISTGVLELQKAYSTDIMAYSNEGKMYVKNSGSETFMNTSIQIYNSLGELINEQQKTITPKEIDSIVLPNPGRSLYFVTIRSNKNELIFSKKIFVDFY